MKSLRQRGNIKKWIRKYAMRQRRYFTVEKEILNHETNYIAEVRGWVDDEVVEENVDAVSKKTKKTLSESSQNTYR